MRDVRNEALIDLPDIEYLDGRAYPKESGGAVLMLDVNPYARTLTAHDRSGTRTYESGGIFQHSAFPWLRFEVSEAFSDLDDD